MGGKVQPQSGAGWARKGDVIADEFLIECKTTAGRSYRVDIGVIEKIDREAMLEGKEFALFIEISGRNYVLVHEDCFVAMAEASKGTL
jgi:hypothetical protein